MWIWDVNKINCIHPLKRVEDLRVFLDIATLLVEERIRSMSKITQRLNLDWSTIETYRLQGRVCSGHGGKCSGGSKCLGRFRLWKNSWTPINRSYGIVEDYRNGSFEAGMLKICLKAVPHFFEFCQILSHGAYITQRHASYQFRIFKRERKPLSLDERQLQEYVNKNLRVRFGRDLQIPNEDVTQFVFWGKGLKIISRNPTFGRFEFNVKMFEKYLDIKKIFSEFSKDRSIMEGYS